MSVCPLLVDCLIVRCSREATAIAPMCSSDGSKIILAFLFVYHIVGNYVWVQERIERVMGRVGSKDLPARISLTAFYFIIDLKALSN